ncbi:MAG: hypothetical protein MUP44_11500, partial [Anaerolineales bacterium]|nr:hypothetical protein [Anaerolineales bacterium]
LPAEAAAILTTAQESQLPILARLPLGIEKDVALAALGAGVHAVVIGPPRGSLLRARGEIISGRLYGPGIFPLALHELEKQLHDLDVPVILGCGLFSVEHVHAAFMTGAAGIQLDTILWVDPDAILHAVHGWMDIQPTNEAQT